MKILRRIVFIFLLCPLFVFGQTVKSYNQLDNKVIVTLAKGELQIIPLTDNTVRIQYGIDFSKQLSELVFTEKINTPNFKVWETSSSIEISLPQITIIVDKKNGTLSYANKDGKTFLSEKPQSRILKSSSVQGEACYIAEQHFNSPADEYLYGTGQFQDGYLNIKGLPRRLTQVNSQIAIPFIMSSKGYGLLWHNYGLTDYNPANKTVELESVKTDSKEETVDITTSEGTKKETRRTGAFNGSFELKEGGKYAFLLDVGQKMARKWQLTIDGKDIINFKNHWLPPTTSTIVHLEAGKHKVEVKGEDNDNPTLFFRKVTNETVFRSPVAEVIDYVVFAGNADEVVSSYRNLSGKAPLMPIWSLGYIHCRERFHSQNELLENAQEFRKRQLPVDLMVQDWEYWGKYGWNAMKFDEDNYPDPAQMVNKLHDMNMRLMLSVWSRIDPNSEVGKEFAQKKYYIPNTQWIDFFNPDAANLYWESFSKNLLKTYHIDAWWQDATEPENDDLVGRKINNGTTPGEVFRNVYPLYVTKAVYNGLRKDAPDKRVFILTRSGFLGQQRYAAAVWSGDVGNNWATLRRQVTAGLNYSITGMPWWTFDAGGFFRPGKEQYNDADYQERFLRWFQFATFSPLQRVHGYQTDTEFWRYGQKVEIEALKYLNLRYRLLPYIYSQAADITFNNGTIMRPLVMDFSDDKQALEQNYEYMFGPSFLVAPVLAQGVNDWSVYLPENKANWYNFWTGKQFKGGQTITTKASISTIPLFVKSGSIIPMGKQVQYSNQKLADTLEIRVYPGSDGQFVLYEDEGTNYNYEKGAYSTIELNWNDANKELTIGERKGKFTGMPKTMNLQIVLVGKKKGVGVDTLGITKELIYKGKEMKVELN